MSVVNDVLKNLNQRHAQENMARHIPHLYEAKPAPQYMLWFLLILILSVSVVIAVFQWQQPSYSNQVIELPSDLFLLDDPVMLEKPSIKNIVKLDTSIENGVSTKSIKAPPPVSIKTHAQIFPLQTKPETEKNEIVNKTKQSKAVDRVITALSQGDHKTAQADLNKTPKSIQDEIRLRLMMKENPEKVLPYLKNNFTNFMNSPSLMAMAAQAQQRSHNHFSALSIYKQLIKLQPQDARWRAGMAISLEASGETHAAKRMYQLALNMPGLPKSLLAFSQKRLSALM